MDKAGPSRDQLADDDVFFQAIQRIFGGGDGRASQHLDGVLEGGGRQERVGAQGGLGDAQQDLQEACRVLALRQQLLVDSPDLQPVDQVAGQVDGVARAGDLDLARHLADDHLKVLVIDVLTLRAVHFLDFGQQVHLAGIASLDAQDAVRVQRTFGQRLTRLRYGRHP